MKISDALVGHVREKLGDNGVSFFRSLLSEHGTVSPVLYDGPIPHPVHFREGMTVRNIMRKSGLCSDWSDHDFDDNWTKVIEKAIG